MLLSASADVNLTMDGGWTVLHVASLCGHVKAVRVLLAAGADPFATTSHGDSALMFAAEDSLECVRALAPVTGFQDCSEWVSQPTPAMLCVDSRPTVESTVLW